MSNYSKSYRFKTHPEYNALSLEWARWRICYTGGRQFIETHLERFARESTTEFTRRRKMTPSPSFAKAALQEITNAIVSRLEGVLRKGGSASYRSSVEGYAGGVDLKSSSMAQFLGRWVIPELLVQGRVGVWIDNVFLPQTPTLSQVGNHHPYLYAYRAENIRNWVYLEAPRQGELSSVLLTDHTYALDETRQLPTTNVENYRHAFLDPDTGKCRVITEAHDGLRGDYQLDIDHLPFVMIELPYSLMKDIDGHQIALMNMLSADVSYCTKSNYPFYVEMYDHRAGSGYVRQGQQKTVRRPDDGSPIPQGATVTPDGQVTTPAGQAPQASDSKPNEVVVGASSGRRVPLGVEMPRFIHPSSEPIRASMDLQEKLKREIKELVLYAVRNVDPQPASAESKQEDWRSLENGLCFIGYVVETLERRIAELWAMYEREEPAQVTYPKTWSALSEAQRMQEATELKKMLGSINSPTYRIEVAKQIVRLLFGHRLPIDRVEQMLKEIEEAVGIEADWEGIVQDLENGLVSAELASKIRGYPKGEVAKAAVEHAARIARIAKAQGSGAPNYKGAEGVGGDPGARGAPDLSADPKAAKEERANDEEKRGKGKKPEDEKVSK